MGVVEWTLDAISTRDASVSSGIAANALRLTCLTDTLNEYLCVYCSL